MKVQEDVCRNVLRRRILQAECMEKRVVGVLIHMQDYKSPCAAVMISDRVAIGLEKTAQSLMCHHFTTMRYSHMVFAKVFRK